jgi:hypothetical protein
MSDEQKLIVEIAARFLVAEIEKHGLSRDGARASWALSHAREIVNGAVR